MTTQLMVLMAAACLLFFIGGIASGLVVATRKRDRYRFERDEAEEEYSAAAAECASLRKKHAALIDEYRNVYESYSIVARKAAMLEQELAQSEARRVADRGMVSDYEKAAFEYNVRVKKQSMLQKENQVLSMQVAVQRKRIMELEELRDQVAEYEEAAAYAQVCQEKIKQQQKEIQRLQGLVRSPWTKGKTVSFKAISHEGTLAGVCNRILNAASRQGTLIGGVIADDMGFPIVASSEYTDELAGVSVLHQYCSSILQKNIDFGNIAKITLKNTANALCTIIPFKVNGQMVYYSGLSQVKTPAKCVSPVTEAVLVR